MQLPPTGWVAIASAVGLAIGAAVGWQRGKMMHIHVDPETHALNQKASPAAMFFLDRADRRAIGRARASLGQESGVSPAMLTDPLIAFALGMFTLHAPRDVSARQALARGGARPQLMATAALLRGAGARGPRAPRRPRFATASRSPRCLREWLPPTGLVLEIASGTGEHAVYFAERFPDARVAAERYPSRRACARSRAWREAAGLPNIRAADRASMQPRPDWPIDRADAVLSINMVHISPWASALGLIDGAARLLAAGRAADPLRPVARATTIETAPSNLAFDADLKRRDPEWGLRQGRGFRGRRGSNGVGSEETRAMPANNLMLLLRSKRTNR